jgi:hypothetical protein
MGQLAVFFLPLIEMSKRFENLQKNGLEREIMCVCKALNIWGRKLQNGHFDKNMVREYCSKRQALYFASKNVFSLAEFDDAIENLRNQEMIENYPNSIVIEEVYLNNISASEESIFEEIAAIFPNSKTFAAIISRANSFQLVRTLFEKFKKQVTPTVHTYSIYINKAPNYQIGAAIFERMLGEGIRPNVVALNTLLKHAPDLPTAQKVLSRFRYFQLHPDKFTYNTLLNFTNNIKEASQIFEEMLQKGIMPDALTYGSLIKHYSFGIAKQQVEYLESQKINLGL